jgi:hypothetical protein
VKTGGFAVGDEGEAASVTEKSCEPYLSARITLEALVVTFSLDGMGSSWKEEEVQRSPGKGLCLSGNRSVGRLGWLNSYPGIAWEEVGRACWQISPKACDLGPSLKGIGFVLGLFFQNENLLKGLIKVGASLGFYLESRSGYSVGHKDGSR